MSPKKKTIADGVIDEPASTAIERVESSGLVMQMTVPEALKRYRELQKFFKKVMVRGEDFGEIPGIAKPTLLQPGAQKLVEVYGLYPTWEWVEVVKDWDRGFFYFESKCVLKRQKDDSKVGEGIGSCNSLEKKYAGRWVPESEVPPHMTKDTLERRDGFEWVFSKDIPPGVDPAGLDRRDAVSKRTGRPYSQWRVALPTYLIPNQDIASQVNTMQKIAAKRALVMAAIGATRSSGIFTQDVEDLPKTAIKADAEAPMGDDAKGETDTYREPPPKRSKKPAKAPLPEVEQHALRAQLLEMIRNAPDLEGLRAVHAQANGHKGELSETVREALGEAFKVRKAELEKGPPIPDTTTDGSDAWGINTSEAPPVDAFVCHYCKRPIEPKSDARPLETRDGSVAFRHSGCVTAERVPGQEG